jgi:hypothetical protein
MDWSAGLGYTSDGGVVDLFPEVAFTVMSVLGYLGGRHHFSEGQAEFLSLPDDVASPTRAQPRIHQFVDLIGMAERRLHDLGREQACLLHKHAEQVGVSIVAVDVNVAVQAGPDS